MKKLGLVCLLIIQCATIALDGQNSPCGTIFPGKLSEEDRRFANLAQQSVGKTNGVVKVIPIVVNVVYTFANDPHNIQQAKIDDQIQILNSDFRGVSGGIDTEIEFCLAGVNRVEIPDLANFDRMFDDRRMKDSVGEDPALYLNIWTVASIANSGDIPRAYSTFPKQFANSPELDGIVIDSDYFGSNTSFPNAYDAGRTLVHEVGHWLNLLHVFQGGCDDNSNCAVEGDCCCDTPPQEVAYYGCQRNKNTCHGDSPDNKDPVRNYMGYSDDDCLREFTACQKARMHLCLDSIRRTAWFVKGGDCPQIRFASPEIGAIRDLEITAFPNPFANSTLLRVTIIGKESPVTISIFDSHGKLVERPINWEIEGVGVHSYSFTAPNSGIYFVRVSTPWDVKTLKVISLQN